MKKITCTAFLFLFSIYQLNAQLTKKNWLVGGEASLSYSTRYFKNQPDSKYNSNVLQVSPKIGYFFVNKFVGGIKLNYSYQLNSNAVGENLINKKLLTGIFTRYYFLNSDKRLNFFSEVNYSRGFDLVQKDDTFSSSIFGISAGAAVFFSSSVSLEFLINYTNIDEISLGQAVDDINFGLGFVIYLQK